MRLSWFLLILQIFSSTSFRFLLCKLRVIFDFRWQSFWTILRAYASDLRTCVDSLWILPLCNATDSTILLTLRYHLLCHFGLFSHLCLEQLKTFPKSSSLPLRFTRLFLLGSKALRLPFSLVCKEVFNKIILFYQTLILLFYLYLILFKLLLCVVDDFLSVSKP